ncbi:MAG: glycosyl transferase family 39 [Sphingobacteriales bacterium]|nr:glycosyl transferase family 39 [Sphingobacteriales bacterium]
MIIPKSYPKYLPELLIVLIGSILFIPFIGKVHLFDWDEINFAEAAREMLITKKYSSVQIDYLPFWEKPPLFIWLQAISMKFFGVNEFAARLPNALCGILTLLCLYRAGKRIFNEQFGVLWVVIYCGTFLTFLYFKSGIIDPVFNLLIFLSVYYLSFTSLRSFTKRNQYLIISGVFLGLAILTKGPVALLVLILCALVILILSKFKAYLSFKELLLFALIVFLVGMSWFGIEIYHNGFWFINTFITYQIRLLQTQDAGHGGPFFYHWIVLLIGCFPASIFAIKGIASKQNGTEEQVNFRKWMLVLFWVVLILFSLVKTKIVHYSSLCYFPLTFLAAYAIHYMLKGYTHWKRIYSIGIIFFGVIVSSALIALPYLMMIKEKFIPLIKDPFAVANLQAKVSWSFLDSIGGLILLAGILITFVFVKQKKIEMAVFTLFASVTITMYIASALLVPKIEPISQGAVIRFYESKKNEDCYIQVMGFKSYAHYFYADKKPVTNPTSRDVNWLLNGKNDKVVYFVTKIQYTDKLEQLSRYQKIGEENGFVFFKREVYK